MSVTVEELKSFIQSHHHPILSRIASIEKEQEESRGLSTNDSGNVPGSAINSSGRNTGMTITFRDVRISADRIFVTERR